MSQKGERRAAPNKGGKSNIIRRLGYLEAYESTLQTLGYYSSTLLTCRYTIPEALRGPEHHAELVDNFESALAAVVIEQPALRVETIGKRSRKPCWAPVDSIDFARQVQWRTVEPSTNYDAAFQAVTEHELDVNFTDLDAGAGWRILVLRAEGGPFLDVMFAWDHAISDGTGAKIFHQRLLRSLRLPRTEEVRACLDGHVLRIPPTARKLAPPSERLYRHPVTPRYVVSMMWKEYSPKAAGEKGGGGDATACWAPVRSSPPVRTRHRLLTIADDALQNVLAACRGRKTTLTGLLHGIATVSIISQLPAHELSGLTSSTALDMRRFMPAHPPSCPWLVPGTAMATFVSTTQHVFDAARVSDVRKAAVGEPQPAVGAPPLEEAIWTVATRVRREIEGKLDLGLKNDISGLLGLVSDWRVLLGKRAQKPRAQSLLVTNLGVLDGDPDPDLGPDEEEGEEEGAAPTSAWSIERAVFSLPAEVPGPALFVCPVAVKGRGLCVTCGWQDGTVDVRLAEKVMSDLESWLRYLGRPVQETPSTGS